MSAADMIGMRGFNGGDVIVIAFGDFGDLSTTTLTGIGALCVRLRIGADCRWPLSFGVSNFPFKMTLCALAGCTGC